jgi:hypothetical protein
MKNSKMNLKEAIKFFGGKRKDTPSLPIECLQFEEGFNAREKYPKTEIFELMCKIFLPIEQDGKLVQTKNCETNLIQPIGGHWDGDENKFIVTDGHRRTMAIRMAVEEYGFEAGLISLRVLPKDEFERAKIVLTSNSQKKLEALEMARQLMKIQKLHEEKTGKKMTLKELGAEAGISHVSVKNYLDLLKLPVDTIKAIEDGIVNYTDAMATVKAIKAEQVEKGTAKKAAEKVAFNLSTVEEIQSRKNETKEVIEEVIEAPKVEVEKATKGKKEESGSDLPTLITIRLKGIIEGIEDAQDELSEVQKQFAKGILGVLKGIKRGDDLEEVMESIKNVG